MPGRVIFQRALSKLARIPNTSLEFPWFAARCLTRINLEAGKFRGAILGRYVRTYATAIKTKKADTATTTKKKPTKKKPTKKEPTRKEPVRKSTATRKKSTTTKKPTAKKTVSKKTKTKKLAATTPAKRTRKPLTETQQAAKTKNVKLAKIRELRETALLKETPKNLPQNSFLVFSLSTETIAKRATERLKEVAAKYKQLNQAEMERLQRTAQENKAKNAQTHLKWVVSHTPDQIRQANLARTSLKRLTGKAVRSIKDDRLVKRPNNVYTMFSTERFLSGDFKDVPLREAAKRVAQEFKTLSEAEKKTYRDLATKDAERYKKQFKEVYGFDPTDKTKMAASKVKQTKTIAAAS